MKKNVLLAALILAGGLPAHAAENPSFPLTPIFVGGDNGYTCFRIPAMITTRKGVVLAAADGRITNCADIPNPLDLVLKRSFDGGKTWGPLQVIAPYGYDTNDVDVYPAYGVTNPIPRLCAGDCALLQDRTNGRIWVIYDNGAKIKQGKRYRTLKLELRYSDDEGSTWSSGVDVEAENPGLRPDITGKRSDFMAGPGNGIQISGGPRAGRLIFPVYVNPVYSSLIYSDDHGRTWHLGGKVGDGGGEIQIAEIGEGRLLATLRNNTFKEKAGVRLFSRSDDAGETWTKLYYETKAQPGVPDPKCQASLIATSGGHGKVLRMTSLSSPKAGAESRDSGNAAGPVLYLSNAADPTSRTNMVLRISYDGGRTWPVSRLIYDGTCAYSSLAELPTGDIGILFEADKYKRIVFTRFHR